MPRAPMPSSIAIRVFSAAFFFVIAGCDRSRPVISSPSPPAPVPEEIAPPPALVATHLGSAILVPKDADLFIASYRTDRLFERFSNFLLSIGVAQIHPPGGDPKELTPIDPALHAGAEAFLFVGSGLAEKISVTGKTYRDLSARLAGFTMKSTLGYLSDHQENPDLSQLTGLLSDEAFDSWLDAFERDSRLSFPSLVIGVKPPSGKEPKDLGSFASDFESALSAEEGTIPVSFTVHGAQWTGKEVPGHEIFKGSIEELRRMLTNPAVNRTLVERVTPQRIERLLSALENFRLTIVSGTVEGRMMLYIGNGREGLRLAENPDESLASTDDLRWTQTYEKHGIDTAFYVSEAMIRSVLPWLDQSDLWNSLSQAVGPPVLQERLIKQLLTELARIDKELSARNPSAWSAIVFENDGISMETRGGWPDPALDYQTPLGMTGAASSVNPAIRANWIQNRARNDLEWDQFEHLALLADLSYQEVARIAKVDLIPSKTYHGIIDEIRALNRDYRFFLRPGIGDEVAFIADFKGSLPAIPNVPVELLQEDRSPRFLVARPVVNRLLIDKAGAQASERWRNLINIANQQSSKFPVVLPQSIQSGDLVTWYPPFPFVGGDFIPGVTMNDRLWMVGTSKSLAKQFSETTTAGHPSGETGMIVEIDFNPIREWLQAMPAKEEPTSLHSFEHGRNELKRLQKLSYHHRLVDGIPRTSYHLKISPRS